MIKNKRFDKNEQMPLLDIMQARRDVRGNNFSAEPLSEEDIKTILKAAECAPSVGLSQPWRFVLIRDKEIKQQIRDNCDQEKQIAASHFSRAQLKQYQELKLDGIIEAPLNMAVYYVPPEQSIIGNNTMPEMGEYSVVCAIQNMWLMARALNIGMGWVSIISPEVVNNVLNAPKEMKLVGYLCFGYSKQFHSIPEFEQLGWEKRSTFSDFIIEEGF